MMPITVEVWEVRHDAWPRPEVFTYSSENEAREAYEKHKFYDPASRWGVTLVRRVTTTEVLETTHPERKP